MCSFKRESVWSCIRIRECVRVIKLERERECVVVFWK